MHISFTAVTETHDAAAGAHQRAIRTWGSTAGLEARHSTAAGATRRTLRAYGGVGAAAGDTGAHRRWFYTFGAAGAMDATATEVFGRARRRLRTIGTAQSGVVGGPPPAPEIPIIGTTYRALASSGVEFNERWVDGSASRHLRSRGFPPGAAPTDAAGVHARQYRSRGAAPGNAGVFVPESFFVDSFASRIFETARMHAVTSTTAQTTPIAHLAAAVLTALTAPTRQLRARSLLQDTAGAHDKLAAWFLQTLSSAARTTTPLDATPRYVARLVDAMLAGGTAASYLDAAQQLEAAVAAVASASAFALVEAQDQVLAGAAVEETVRMVTALLDAALTQSELEHSQRVTVVMDDRAETSDLLEGALAATQLIQDGASVAISLYLDDGQYIAWTYNMQSAGVTRYTNYPFNSFAKVGGVYYGLTSTGLYRLDADDDDGAPIAAKVRLGMSDLNTRRLKSTPEVFMGYTGDGQMLLRVIYVDDKTGEKTGVDYRMKPRPAGSKRESRFEPGKGLIAVDFDYEIENIDGADFSIKNVEFSPMIVTRRTRG